MRATSVIVLMALVGCQNSVEPDSETSKPVEIVNDQQAGDQQKDERHANEHRDDPLYVGQHEDGQSVKWVNVASFSTFDTSGAGKRIRECLAKEDIRTVFFGSRAIKVYVMPDNAARAKQMISQLVKESDLDVYVEP